VGREQPRKPTDAFANDPVTDPTAEALFVRDEETGEVWAPTPGPMARTGTTGRCVIRHSAGLTRFGRVTHGIRHNLDVFVEKADPVKFSLLTLTNEGESHRRLSVFAYNEWVLGRLGPTSACTCHRDRSDDRRAPGQEGLQPPVRGTRVVHARQRSAPLGNGRPPVLSRAQRFPRAAGSASPANALRPRRGGAGSMRRAARRRHARPRRDPSPRVPPGPGARSRTRSRAGGPTRERRRAEAAREAVCRSWDEILDAVQVHTPDDSFDLLMNRWLLYQTVSCRLWARSGYYQPGGAFGFRDQLQDVMALSLTRPDLQREHCCAPRAGSSRRRCPALVARTERPRYTHPLFGRPAVAAPRRGHYVRTTGDADILDERVPFLEAPLLTPDVQEAYLQPRVLPEPWPLFEHCVRAIDKGLTVGAHGLPLIGCGDWNDGMNLVGRQGRGESTWLGFFLHVVLSEFAPLCAARGDQGRSERYRAEAGRLAAMLERTWDGEWYLPATTTTGRLWARLRTRVLDRFNRAVLGGPLGARFPYGLRTAPWTPSHAPGAARARLLLLLTPPFDQSAQDPGYIKGLPPGVRENGGQYTTPPCGWSWRWRGWERRRGGGAVPHAQPGHHTRTAADLDRYKAEPYIMAGDVCAITRTPGARDGRGTPAPRPGCTARPREHPRPPALRLDLKVDLVSLRRGLSTRLSGGSPDALRDRRVQPAGVCRGIGEAELDGVSVDWRAILW